MTPNRDNQVFKALSPADGETLDALFEAEKSGDQIRYRQIAATDRGRKVVQLRNLIELGLVAQIPTDNASDDLVARTMARIAASAASIRARQSIASGQTDFDLLDALLESKSRGQLESARSLGQSERGRRVDQWLNLIDLIPAAAPSDDLVARTMARIEKQSRRETVLANINDHRPAAEDVRAIAFRWRELISVAAMLLIAVSLLWPIMARTRSDAMRIACASNLATTGMGMGHYAADNHHVLPRYATTMGSTWWNVGRPVRDGVVESNSAHLYKLRREGYTSITNLNCPTNGEAPQQLAISAFDWPNARAISYSYQNQYTPEPIHVGKVANLVVLADKNPLFTPAASDADAEALKFDPSHGLSDPGNRHAQPGQNTLVIDGSVRWTETPVLKDGGDNFYTAGNLTSYRGNEAPTGASDSFLVP